MRQMTAKARIIYALLLLMCLFFASAPAMMAAANKKFTLVIDAGHGGKDAGALGKSAKEKNINLNVALAFGRYVEQNCPDVKVIYTRKTDVFVPLHERAAIANRNKADVFISIHTNAIAGKQRLTGMETYTMGMRRSGEKLSAAMRENDVVLIEDNFQQHYSGFDPRSPESYIIFEMINDANMLESVKLAKTIQKNVCRIAKRADKGVKQDAFLVLRETSMPACLIELGYVTTPSEEAYLTNKANVETMGRGIYQAFVEYKAQKAGGGTPRLAKEHRAAEREPATTDTAPAMVSQGNDEREAAKPQQTKEGEDGMAERAIVFKVQFLTSDRKLKPDDKQLKGVKEADCYKEGALWKYTVGCSSDYKEMLRLRRKLARTFPKAFIVAFRDGKRMDLDEAKKAVGVN